MQHYETELAASSRTLSSHAKKHCGILKALWITTIEKPEKKLRSNSLISWCPVAETFSARAGMSLPAGKGWLVWKYKW